MTDTSAREVELMNNMCYSVPACGSGFRRFLTKEEKIEMLNEYKEYLENEAKGVAERIAEIEKS